MRFLKIALFATFLFSKTLFAQSDYKIIVQDALNFWKAYDSLELGVDTVAIFQRNVFDQSSVAFKIFSSRFKITPKQYAAQVKRYPKFYASIKQNCLQLCRDENEIRVLVENFRKLYPDFTPADIVVGFGNFSTGGTVSVSQADTCAYIGLEFHGLGVDADTSEMSEAAKDYLSRSNFYRTVIHELVHVQQETHGKKVKAAFYHNDLASTILREGIPEFIASLIYPKGSNGRHFAYGIDHEEELKQRLKTELWGTDKTYWIYNSKTVNDTPRDLGYFMGYCIANAFYENNKDKKDGIKSMIEVNNVKEFIRKSGYFD